MITMVDLPTIKLMAEYRSTGIFGVEPENLVGEISHEFLGISATLSHRIDGWIAIYDGWLNWEDPANSPKTSQEKIDEFNKEGRRLTFLLQHELKGKYRVIYQEKNEEL